MDRDIRIAVAIAAGCVGLLVGFIFLTRYLVPTVLGAPFEGSLVAAALVGLMGVVILVWAAWRLFLWARRALHR